MSSRHGDKQFHCPSLTTFSVHNNDTRGENYRFILGFSQVLVLEVIWHMLYPRQTLFCVLINVWSALFFTKISEEKSSVKIAAKNRLSLNLYPM